MPANHHLEWFEIKEFGGLWTAGASSLMPADRAQVLSGAHPQPGGGLRAFLRPTETYAARAGMAPDHGPLPLGNTMVAGFNVYTVGASTGESLTVMHLLTGVGRGYLGRGAACKEQQVRADAAALDITGDLDLRTRTVGTWPPSTAQTFISKLDAAAFTGYELSVDTAGVVSLSWGNGAAVLTRSATVALADPDASTSVDTVMLKATLDVDNGAGGHDVKFYWAHHDTSTWTQIGATVTTAGVTSIANGDEALTIGRRPGSAASPGTLWYAWAQVRSGIDGTLVADADFTVLPASDAPAPAFTDSTGKVWTFTGSCSIVPHTLGLHAQQGLGPWYLWQARVSEGAAAWDKVVSAFDGTASYYQNPPPAQPSFVVFDPAGTSATLYLAISLREDGDVSGIYSIDWDSTPTSTQLATATEFSDSDGARAMVVHQNRIVAGERDRIRFTEVETADFDSANAGFFILNPTGYNTTEAGYNNQGAVVAWMLPVPPGDLLVGTTDGRIYSVQGDLSDPTIRDLGRWNGMLPQTPANTPNGMFIMLPSRGVAKVTLDGSLEVVSKDLLPTVWNPAYPRVGLGQLAGTERFLFAPNQHDAPEHKNGPLVLDHLTGAWFTATHSDDHSLPNPRFMQSDDDPLEGSIWVVSGVSPQSGADILFRYPVGGGYGDAAADETRNETWEWRSAPLRSPDGRQLIIREVQIPVHAFNAATSTLAVTVGGTTITRTLGAGRSVESFLFRVRGEHLDITVKAKSNAADVEAPMIEGVRVGWRPGGLL